MTTHKTQFPPLESVTRTAVDTASAAHYLNRRPQTLRRADGLESRFAGMVTLYPGQNPLDALDGRGPGLWFLIDHDLNGPGLMGRVSRDGKRTIIYGGHHATA